MSKYSRVITREHRSAYILLLDTSSSMQEMIDYEGHTMTKGESMVYAANKIIQELYFRASSSGEMRNYYDLAVISYSGRGVVSMLDGEAPLQPITSIESDLLRWNMLKCITPLNAPDEKHGKKIAISLEGYTPMYEALYVVHELFSEWCSRPENYESSPPMLFHITDGHATDGDLKDIEDMAARVKRISTNDGNVLIFNIHLASCADDNKVLFPTDSELDEHPNAFFRTMGKASSIMPDTFTELIHEIRGSRSSEPFRGVGVNVSIVDMISIMNIGTLSTSVV